MLRAQRIAIAQTRARQWRVMIAYLRKEQYHLAQYGETHIEQHLTYAAIAHQKAKRQLYLIDGGRWPQDDDIRLNWLPHRRPQPVAHGPHRPRFWRQYIQNAARIDPNYRHLRGTRWSS